MWTHLAESELSCDQPMEAMERGGRASSSLVFFFRVWFFTVVPSSLHSETRGFVCANEVYDRRGALTVTWRDDASSSK